MLVQGVENVAYDELGEIELKDGEKRRCRVLEVNDDNVLVQLFDKSVSIGTVYLASLFNSLVSGNGTCKAMHTYLKEELTCINVVIDNVTDNSIFCN